MRVGSLAAVTLGAGAACIAFACGTQLAPAPSENGTDGGVDASEPAEPPLDEFGCGIARCKVKVQVCCVVGADPTCAPIGEGCDDGGIADADAGPPPKPLECTTYRVCTSGNDYGIDCCWSAAQGSSCKNDCETDQLRLCQDGDGCGYGASCVPIPGDPLGPGVKQCVNDGSGGSSGWSSGGSGPGSH